MKQEEIICPLNNWGRIKFSGKATAVFLQGQFTCDVSKVTDRTTHFGAYCNRKGRVLAAFQLFLDGDAYYAYLPRATVPLMLNAMQAYARLAKVTLSDVSNERDIIGVVTPSEPVARRFKILEHGSTPAFAEGAKQGNANDWRLFNIKAGIGYIYPETSGVFTPHQLEYPQLQAISFTKGCYLGQEIIARTEHLGKRKYARYSARLDKASPSPQPGNAIVDADGVKVGAIIDVAPHTADAGYCLLASLLIKAATEKSNALYVGEPLQTPSPEKIITDVLQIKNSVESTDGR